jgi:hypothetical protein
MCQPLKYLGPMLAQQAFEEAIRDGRVKLPASQDGIPLTSISHPPCAMFPEKDEEERERIERIWEATKAASGG